MKKTSTIKIGKHLQQIRKSFGYTQEKLAEEIDVSTRYIGEVEQERVQPSYEVLIRYCNTFGIGMDDIFSKYLTKTGKKKVAYTIAGYEKLKEKDKQTIEHLIMFFNSEK